MAVDATELPTTLAGHWQRDIIAGVFVGVLALPVCMAAGVLAFAPLGPKFVAEGAAAGLYGAVVAGFVAALVATSSFAITCPRSSAALVLASLMAALAAKQVFAGDTRIIIGAAALCVFVSGVWQILFGVFRLADIIKFTPHPVFAGLCNGVALLIVRSQIEPFFLNAGHSALALPRHPLVLALVVLLALLALYYRPLVAKLRLPAAFTRLPGTIVAFGLGIALYHIAVRLDPTLDLGPMLGKPMIGLSSPLLQVVRPDSAHLLWPSMPSILLTSLVLAIITSMDSLIALRAAQLLGDIELHPMRDLSAQGCGNVVVSLFAPIASSATPSLQSMAYEAGGRSRLAGIVAAAFILIVGLVFTGAIAMVPNAVLSAVLLAAGVALFDAWSFRLLGQVVRKSSPLGWKRALTDLIVVAVVMGITAMTTVVIGVLVGGVMSGIIFVVNMSRPVVRRRYSGHEYFSKRIRSAEDMTVLQQTGTRRAVLQLEGVLFFGNAENLADHVKELFKHADTVALDLRAITDIDISGVNILKALVTRSGKHDKHLLFCNVPSQQVAIVRDIFDNPDEADAAIKPDLESMLEWMEDETLRDQRQGCNQPVLTLEQIDFFNGVPAAELAQLRELLKLREFKAGEAICREGDPGDKMWLLVMGSVSVRIHVADGRGSRRVTSLTRGTVFGEMALIEGAPRSATIVADEDVACYELGGRDFDALMRERPAIATTIMRNIARELARRLRRTSEDLRQATS